ncbi:MAG: hypothetical protein U1E41_04605 [Paracoccus sp. (in: a-proteobacteria)]|jgi:hypothetical protein
MAVSVEELIEMRDALIRQRAKGARVLQMAGERIEFQTFADMDRTLADLEARIQRASGTSQPGAIRFNTSKGF